MVESLESRTFLSVNVTTYHYDLSRTGANTNETTLTPANVNESTFGKVGSFPVDGQIYAQPLVMTGEPVAGQGTHDLLLVATESDTIYAFDAEGNNPAQGYLWKYSLLQANETPISAAATGTNDITPNVGITGTPVIDPNTNTMYVVGDFHNTVTNVYSQRLYAINLSTGQPESVAPNGLTINAEVPSLATKDPNYSNGMLHFFALWENQRPALTLANGEVYVGFSSHGDNFGWHGWLLAYNEATLNQDYAYCTTPDVPSTSNDIGGQGGIWMSGGGLSVDAAGNLYFSTGNGDFDANNGGNDYSMAVQKLSPNLTVQDYFSPSNEASLSNADLDYGCSDVILLPNQGGSAPNETVSAGKWGGLFVNNSNTGSMGEFNSSTNNDLSQTNIGTTLHNTISYWNGFVYVGGDGQPLKAYSVVNGVISANPTSQSVKVFGTTAVPDGQGSAPSISSNGTSDGIVWTVDNSGYNNNPAVLYAYNANDLSQLLYSSAQAPGGRDTCGDAVKFQSAVVANGLVYVAGANSVTVYGNITPTPPVPPPPPGASSISGFGHFTLNGANGAGIDGSAPGDNNPSGVPGISTDNNTLTITTQSGNEASSAFFNSPAGYQNFTANFIYSDQSTGGADGITFTLENDSRGANALGGGGGDLGYGSDSNHPATSITNSFSAQFNIYQSSSISVGTDGAITVNNNPNSSNTGSVNLDSGDPINVTLSYNSSAQTITETLVDQATNARFSTTFTGINLASILGTTSAFVGFTGGTGGVNALQTISNFSYAATPIASVSTFKGFITNAANGAGIDGSAPGDNNPPGVPGISSDNSTLTITTQSGNEAGSAFYQTPVSYQNFSASFIYTDLTGPSSGADGVTFTLEDDPRGANALGGGGGDLGYATDGSHPATAIAPSFAIAFNIYQVSSTADGINGATGISTSNSNTGAVNVASGDPIQVNLSYSQSTGVVMETLTDTVTHTTDTIDYYGINLSSILGSQSAYMGFTGGTGGVTSNQTISSLTYSTSSSPQFVPAQQVNLASVANTEGIEPDGTPSQNGGFDGGGFALSSVVLGTTQTTPSGNLYDIGYPNQPDVVTAAGQTIKLPEGNYSSLTMLGAGVNGGASNQTITVTYTDGSTQTFTQSYTDWFNSSGAAGEVKAIQMPYRLNSSGGQGGGPCYLSEYTYGLNPAKTIASVTLPNNGNVKIVAMDLLGAPIVTGVSPATGPTTGGTTVNITGSGFTSGSTVMFGTAAATSVTVNSSTSITVVSPPINEAAIVDIVVTDPNGQSATSSADQFTYLSFPLVSSVTPNSGPTSGGTTVYIHGSGFINATGVSFGSTPASSFTIDSGTLITAVDPAATNTGTVDVTVSNVAGSSPTGASDQFVYTNPTLAGFNNFTLNSANGLGVNGSSPMDNNPQGTPGLGSANTSLTLTTQNGNEASSAFFNTPLGYQNFTASFTYQETGNPGADGVTFTIEDDSRGVHAIGGGGGDLGYGSDSGHPADSIAPSFSAQFNIYQSSTISVAYDGSITVSNAPNTSNTGSVSLQSGDPINVTFSYNSAAQTLVETLTDALTSATFSTTYTGVNLAAILQSNTAYIGFTGGTGGVTSKQVISNFAYNATVGPAIAQVPPTTTVTNFSAFTTNAANGNGIDGSSTVDSNPAGLPGISSDNNTLTLTTQNNNIASSAFNDAPVYYTNFDASFIYTDVSGGGADGVTFTLQDDRRGLNSLGGGGGDLGLGTDLNHPATAISPSFSIEFDVFGGSNTSMGTNGAITTANSGSGSVNIASGDPILVNIAYNTNASTVTETLTDTITHATFSTTYTGVNLAAILGKPTAYMGFTGGTGGITSEQTVSNLNYSASTADQVDLTNYVNGYGIGANGAPGVDGGFDGGGSSLSGALLGTVQTVGSPAQTFFIRTPYEANTITATGQTVAIPQGNYNSISLLGAAVNGNQGGQTVTVDYTDGTTQTFTQGFSDWFSGGPYFAGETKVIPMAYRLNPNGSQDNRTFNVYEYTFSVNPNKIVSGITLPNDGNIKFLAIDTNAATSISSVTPNSGYTIGGTSVTITGTGFTDASSVTFGGVAATSFVVNSDYSITAVAPAEFAGTVDVVVTAAGGTSQTSAADQFTYISVPTTTTVTSSNSASYYGQSVTFTATVTSQAANSGVPTGSVQFFDNNVSLGIVALSSNGTATFTTSSLPLGSDNITATYIPANTTFAASSGSTTQNVTCAVLLLDSSGKGALTVSGTAQVNANGSSIIVDSNNSAAIVASGSGVVNANLTDVVGGASVASTATVSNVQTGQASVADPFASLPAPSTTGMTVQSTSTLTIGGSTVVTLQPGIYTGGIFITGDAKVTLAPGIYYLNGGGFTVNHGATVTGQGVMLYNAPSKATDQISIGGAASVTLSPMTTGTYAGITIFQNRTSTAAINVSNSGTLDVSGDVYAASAVVNITGASGVDTFGTSLIADDLNVSGSGELLY